MRALTVEEVPFCGCTNEQLERGRHCGLAMCPNSPCRHAAYADGHCAEMPCVNYVNRCPRHSTGGRSGEKCSRESL